MNIECLVVEEAMRHIDTFSNVKGMDPFALHILKTSEDPLVAHFRGWMRRAALWTVRQAEREQARMNEEFSREPYAKKAGLRRRAVIHPDYVSKAVQDGHAWGDQDFLGYVEKNNPKVFPKREPL